MRIRRVFQRFSCILRAFCSNSLFSVLVRIRRAGYPIRHGFDVFASRYHMLVIGLGSMVVMNPKEATRIIAENSITDSDWQIGHTKIFLKVRCI